jgi:proline dehydrogenase
MLRGLILAAARADAVKDLVAGAPGSRQVVARFVAGPSVDDAVRVGTSLVRRGLAVTLDRLGEDVHDAAQATAAVRAYVQLLDRLTDAGLTDGARAEVSVKLTAVGQAIDQARALDNAREICAAAAATGTTVTLDMEDHTTTDSTLSVLHALRADFPSTGAVLQAYLRRTEADCRDLATTGGRVRLCKGAYREPASVAYHTTDEVDRSYLRCLQVLVAGDCYPMVATHDPKLIAAALSLVADRDPSRYEFQLLYGVRPLEQQRLARAGHTVRVYVPYGDQWYGYLMRRLAERPANLTFFARALVTRS